MILALLAAFLIPASSTDELVVRDARALEAAHASVITQPVLDCIKARFDEHKVTASEKGDTNAALRFASDQIQKCGLEATRTKVEAALRDADPSATEADAKRRTTQHLGFIAAAASMRAMNDFEVQPEPPPVSLTVPTPERGRPK